MGVSYMPTCFSDLTSVACNKTGKAGSRLDHIGQAFHAPSGMEMLSWL